MADDVAASGGRLGDLIAQRRRRSRIGVARALCGFLVLCAGCALSSGEAVSASRSTPVMATTLLLKPVDSGRLTSGYGPRYNPVLKRRQMHRGIDWAAPRGTPVRAAGNGVVVAIERSGAYGRYLEIDHGGTVPLSTPISTASRPACASAADCAKAISSVGSAAPGAPRARISTTRCWSPAARSTSSRYGPSSARMRPVGARSCLRPGPMANSASAGPPQPSPTPRRAIPPSCRRGVWATCRSKPTAP